MVHNYAGILRLRTILFRLLTRTVLVNGWRRFVRCRFLWSQFWKGPIRKWNWNIFVSLVSIPLAAFAILTALVIELLIFVKLSVISAIFVVGITSGTRRDRVFWRDILSLWDLVQSLGFRRNRLCQTRTHIWITWFKWGASFFFLFELESGYLGLQLLLQHQPGFQIEVVFFTEWFGQLERHVSFVDSYSILLLGVFIPNINVDKKQWFIATAFVRSEDWRENLGILVLCIFLHTRRCNRFEQLFLAFG